MKLLARAVLATYIALLLWLVLFKFSADPLSVLANYQSRSLNMVPLAGNLREMFNNFIAFVPFGLLLGINFKQSSFGLKLACIAAFSVAVEISQFVWAIGTTDITDAITNTLGGFFGLAAYSLARKYSNSKVLDWCILVILAALFVGFILLRLLVFKVRY